MQPDDFNLNPTPELGAGPGPDLGQEAPGPSTTDFDAAPAAVPEDDSNTARLSLLVELTKKAQNGLTQLIAAFKTMPGIDDEYSRQIESTEKLLGNVYFSMYQKLADADGGDKSLKIESVEDRIGSALFEDGVTKEKKKTDKEMDAVIQQEKVGSHPDHWYTNGAKANSYGSGGKFNDR